jgi:hypothetical protein
MQGRDAEHRFLEAVRSLNLSDGKETLSKVALSIGLSEVDDQTDSVETTEHEDDEKKAEASPPLPHINLFQHPDSHPAVLDLLLLRKYGPEWMLWEPETLQFRIPQDFHTTEVSDLNLSKIQAMKTLHLSDTPWQRWEVFVWCTMPLNGIFPDFEVMQVPSVPQSLVAIDIFNKVRRDVAWSDELKVYLGVVWHHDGVFCPIDPADFVKVDTTDTGIDCSKILAEWPSVRKADVAPTAETVEAEQLRRMLVAHQYLKESRDLFDRQVGAVLGV